MKKLKNILLVSGSGRNCGKTTLACHIIGQLAKTGRVVGLKITPHFHLTGNNQQIVAEGDGYRLFRETDLHSGKDSARMLNAGASEVYFVQSADKNLPEVYNHMKTLLPENCPVVCESGSFAKIYRPGLHLLVKGIHVDDTKASYKLNLKKADIILTQEDFTQTSLNFHIDFLGLRWTIKKTNYDKVRRSA